VRQRAPAVSGDCPVVYVLNRRRLCGGAIVSEVRLGTVPEGPDARAPGLGLHHPRQPPAGHPGLRDAGGRSRDRHTRENRRRRSRLSWKDAGAPVLVVEAGVPRERVHCQNTPRPWLVSSENAPCQVGVQAAAERPIVAAHLQADAQHFLCSAERFLPVMASSTTCMMLPRCSSSPA